MPPEPDIVAELGPAVRALAVGQIVFGRYELRRKLGEGGFGAVWLVRDSALREEVAIKFVLQAVAASPEAIDTLKAEASRCRRLTHPNIVRIHDFVSDAVGDAHPDLAGISMEYVEGESLAQRRLREPGKCFDVEQIAPWIDQLCTALTYAHAPKRRVIHRDLKPPNLLLANDGELKVADFGIACSLINSVTQIAGRLSSGTPTFMSPQQLGGEWPSERDDIYALGATIYALLTGTPPFHQGDIVHQVMNRMPPPMRERRDRREVGSRRWIPGFWEETVAACLAKHPRERPISAEAVAQRLGLRPQIPAPAPIVPHAPPVRETIRVEPEPHDEEATIQARPARSMVIEPNAAPLRVPAPPATPPPPVAAPHAGSSAPVRNARLKWAGLAALALLLLLTCVYVLNQPSGSPTPHGAMAPEDWRLAFPLQPLVLGDDQIHSVKFGYIDGFGREVIPAEWDSPQAFSSEGLAQAVRDGKWGYIDRRGAFVIPPEWESALPFSEGLAAVQTEGKWGYLDLKGKLVIPTRWQQPDIFSEGLAAVKSEGKWGYLDQKGKLVIPAQWEEAGHFSEGLAPVRSGLKWGFINPEGKLVIAEQWDNWGNFVGGLAALGSDGKGGYINPQGTVVIGTKWERWGQFSEGLAAVLSGGKWGYIDTHGNAAIPLQWEDATPFAGGMALVKNGGKWGAINREGKLVIPLGWDAVTYGAAVDGQAFFQLARAKAGSPPPTLAAPVPADSRWVDSTGRVIWQSPP